MYLGKKSNKNICYLLFFPLFGLVISFPTKHASFITCQKLLHLTVWSGIFSQLFDFPFKKLNTPQYQQSSAHHQLREKKKQVLDYYCFIFGLQSACSMNMSFCLSDHQLFCSPLYPLLFLSSAKMIIATTNYSLQRN